MEKKEIGNTNDNTILNFYIMITFVKCNSKQHDFIELTKALDTVLADLDGDDHAFYDQFNKIDLIQHAIVAYKNRKPIACGAFKVVDNNTVEIKRMYVKPEFRGKRVAEFVLIELESWAISLGYYKSILETGEKQVAAIQLYTRNDYNRIDNFGPYVNVFNSLCFSKTLFSQ